MERANQLLRTDAVAIYDAAKAGVEPARAVTAALDLIEPAERVWILAVGKAAVPMATAAIARLRQAHRGPLGGIVVAPDVGLLPHGAVARFEGDHPLPGPRSESAARAIEALLPRVSPSDEVWVLLSGGASSLIGVPIPEISPDDFAALQSALFGAGLSIDRLNAARKRFARFGAGRLQAGLGAALVRVLALSDVPSDDPIDIGSGPCEPDPTTATEIGELLATALGADRIPRSVADYLHRVAAGLLPETPKPADPIFDRRVGRIVAGNRIAVRHAEAAARALGYDARVETGLVEGDAAEAGRAIAARVAAARVAAPTAWLLGGETTVRLGPDAGSGGRCQELALAAAAVLGERAPAADVVILAAGTDGRDGPTDAAGAVVDPRTWSRITRAGIDPAEALRRHDAYRALDSVDALLRTGPTGTNVMDLVIALRRPPDQSGGLALGSR